MSIYFFRSVPSAVDPTVMDQRSGSDVNQNASSKSYTDEVYASLLDVTEVRLLSLLVKYLTGRSCYFPDSPH